MRLRRVLTGVMAAGVMAAGAGAEPTDPRVAQRVATLTRATAWTQVAAIPIRFRTFHPQGMVKIGEHFFVSSVEVRREPKKLAVPDGVHRYDAGAGVGHLFKIAADGRLLADLTLGEGTIYHPGGIDYDGAAIWVPVAEYRPNSRAIVYRVAPETMTATRVLTVDDHVGGIVHDTAARELVGVSWGSRRLYRWPLGADGAAGRGSGPVANPTSYIDYQDCHYVGARKMLCGGLAGYRLHPDDPVFSVGGLDLIDLTDHRPVWQTPIPLWSPSGRPMTQNPFWIEPTATGLRLYFMPDDDVSVLYVYETVTP